METSEQMRNSASRADMSAAIAKPRSGQFYFCPSRRGVLKELWFGLSSGEAGVLTGAAGLGKTLLCRELLRRLPAAVHSVYMVAPLATQQSGDRRLLDNIVQSVAMMRAAQDASDQTTVRPQDPASHLAVIVDEAQRLSVETLRHLAEWRNRETNDDRSVGLLLIGPPELQQTLSLPELRQFDSQIATRCELPVFPRNETQAYIEHWLKSSMTSRVEFSESANRIVHYTTGGVPQEIDRVCQSVLDSVRERKKSSVTALVVARAIWKASKRRASGDGDPTDLLQQLDPSAVDLRAARSSVRDRTVA